MSLITVVITLALAGLLLYGMWRAPWIDAGIKKIIYAVVVVVVVVWLLKLFGVWGYLANLRV